MKKNFLLLFAAVSSSLFFSGCVDQADRITFEEEELPSSFRLTDEKKVTPVKSQGNIENSWAFSVMAAIESNIIIKGLAKQDTLDLSEGHLYNYLYMFEDDRNFFDKTDGYYILEGKENREIVYDLAGSSIKAAEILANGVGPENERNLPLYLDNISKMPYVIEVLERADVTSKFNGRYILTEFCSYENANIDEMKRAVQNNGAMYISFYKNDKYSSIVDNKKTYFGIARETANQNGIIIGWDDNFSKENFTGNSKSPENNGAWLVQGNFTDDKDQYDYCWISYEEPSLTEKTTFDFSSRETADLVLFHDSIGCHDSVKTTGKSTKIANVFQGVNGKMISVGLYTLCDSQKVKIKVYKNPDKNKPDSGQLVSEVERTIRWQGYHTIDIESNFNIDDDDRFSIVAEYESDENADSEYGLAPVEGFGYKDDIINTVLNSNKGESYIWLENDSEESHWYDLYDRHTAEKLNKKNLLNNACLKALIKTQN